VNQMIEQGKYEEAKEAIELAVWNDKTSSWARTYYTRGLLCQTAYEDGIKKKESKKINLYPDQLYLAYSSYEKALDLDSRQRLHATIAQKYYLLSNDFRVMGSELYDAKDYEGALKAFEYALLINKNDLIHAKVDTNLIYNTAIAAYKCENWAKAIGYLTGLHENAHATSTTLLLYKAYLASGDTLSGEEILFEALELYRYENQLVAYLVNLLAEEGRYEEALAVLDKAIKTHPENYRLYWSKGLIYIRMGETDRAIENFRSALEIAPDEAELYYHIGIVYYNKAIDLQEQSLRIKNSEEYMALKDLSRQNFQEAMGWLEKSYEIDPFNEKTIAKLYQVYNQLQMKEKAKSMRLLIQ